MSDNGSRSGCEFGRTVQAIGKHKIVGSALGREKVKGRYRTHVSWLRLYAIRLESGRYIITGGAIKLTATMREREHTLTELTRLNKVRDYLISLGIFDYKGFEDYNEGDG